jgi:hypothetical protein
LLYVARRWRCTVEPSGSVGCNLRSEIDLLALCRRHGAREPIHAHEDASGEPMSATIPIVPLLGGPPRTVQWTSTEISTATVFCQEHPSLKVHIGWDGAGHVYEGVELARRVRGDVAKRAALVSELLLPPWKKGDGSILASEKGEVCGDLYSPNDDDGLIELNTVSTEDDDGNAHPPTFAKCRIDLASGRAGCAPKAAHPCPEAHF